MVRKLQLVSWALVLGLCLFLMCKSTTPLWHECWRRDLSISISQGSWCTPRAATCTGVTAQQQAASQQRSAEMCCQTSEPSFFKPAFQRSPLQVMGGLVQGMRSVFYFSSRSCTNLAVSFGKGPVAPLKNKSLFYLSTASFKKEQHSKHLHSWSDSWNSSEPFTQTEWTLDYQEKF